MTRLVDRLPTVGLWSGLTWAGMGLALLLALIHLLQVVNPLPMMDNWTMLDVFVRTSYGEGVGIDDFLFKRDTQDHAQPFSKALLWLNAHLLGLDFLYEGVFALLVGGTGALLVLRRVVLDRDDRETWWSALVVVAIAAVLLSSNSSFLYTYPMVTMWLFLYLGMLATALLCWRAVEGGRLWPVPVVGLVFGMVADDVAYLAGASLIVALVIVGRWVGWREVAKVGATVLGSVVLSRLVYVLFAAPVPESETRLGLGEWLDYLGAHLGDLGQWWAVPASEGLAHRTQLHGLVGVDVTPWVAGAIAAVMIPCHVWFWWAALRRRPDLTAFVAIALMLFYYAHVAGILYGRVPTFGLDYLHVPRYVSFYQLGVVALLLMAASRLRTAHADGALVRWALAVPAALVIAFQVPLTWNAFDAFPRVDEQRRDEAAMLGQLVRDPEHPPAGCERITVLCLFDTEKRERVFQLLRDEQLSVYSPRFQERHPDLVEAFTRAQAP